MKKVLLIAGLTAAALALSGCGKIAHTLDTPDGEDHPLNFYPNPKLDPQPNVKEALPSSADQPAGAPATIQPSKPYGVMPDSPVITNSGPMMGGTTTPSTSGSSTPQ
ncbi:hypothetical protein AZA_43906 [Nitrospirillum viridazoti Y2]|uniref:Lipoprotein n=1 Tax=Nitrospirillum amazonense TaxID=28077 RepID=A0A560I3A6_9PROT|nr:hypothetical protein [Nitrospirillum amazonense]EGY01142.1 hypothetical protein AZA_43906 [Nitrospirillum amazonense Y2]TWB52661.1 hypothetical protein FBZ92_11826 [Nitrospirillum amazonense]